MAYTTVQLPSRYTSSLLTTAAYITLVLTAFFIPISITGTNICITATALLSLLSGQVFTHRKMIKDNPLVHCVLLIYAMVLLSLLWSIAPLGDQLSALHKYAKLLYIPLLLPLCIDPRWRQRALTGFLLAMTITVFLSYLKVYLGIDFGKKIAASTVFHSHIETSYFVSFATYIFAHRAWKNKKHRTLNLWLVIIFTFQEFFINDGLTGWVAYFCLLPIFFIHHIRSNKSSHKTPATPSMKLMIRNLFYSLIAILLVAFVSYSFSKEFREKVDNSFQSLQQYHEPARQQKNPSVGFRINFFLFSLKLIEQHPIVGLGAGGFKQAYRQSSGILGWKKKLDIPHSEYLMMATQFGLVGLALLLWLFYTQYRMSFHLGNNQYLGQALVFSYALSCVYNNFLYTSTTGYFYVLFTSLLFAAYPSKKVAEKRPPQKPLIN